MDSYVLRPISMGLPQVRSRKRRRSDLIRQISRLSRPMTPLSATAATRARVRGEASPLSLSRGGAIGSRPINDERVFHTKTIERRVADLDGTAHGTPCILDNPAGFR